jgi:transposase
MTITTLSIDLAKHVFHVLGADRRGRIVLRKKLTRKRLAQFVGSSGPCVIGMEACAGAHYWARRFDSMGHTVRLMHPRFVKPYVKTNKNDFNDAEGILEAVGRPTMRFVPVNTPEQQDVQALHRVRRRLVKQRTALTNQIHGLLHEYGIALPRGRASVRSALPALLEDASNELTPTMRRLLAGCYEELCALAPRIETLADEIKAVSRAHEECQRLSAIEGYGPLTSTALSAAVGDARTFKNGRQMAAWLGLVPKQASTGGRTVLLGISKRGDPYLRTLLIEGAMSAVRAAATKDDARSRWINALRARRGVKIAAVAVANKNARIAWALLAKGRSYCAAT